MGATLGLVVTVLVSVRLAPALAPAAVGVYLAVAIVVAPSGAFANPAVTLARAWTDTPTGIAPGGVLVFLAAQATGAALAVALVARLPARHPPRE